MLVGGIWELFNWNFQWSQSLFSLKGLIGVNIGSPFSKAKGCGL